VGAKPEITIKLGQVSRRERKRPVWPPLRGLSSETATESGLILHEIQEVYLEFRPILRIDFRPGMMRELATRRILSPPHGYSPLASFIANEVLNAFA
jgi:hypothetical protein